MMSTLSDEELRGRIYSLVPRIDIETMGLKAFIGILSQELSAAYGCDNDSMLDVLRPRKDYIKEILTEAINSDQAGAAATAAAADEHAHDEDEEEEEEAPSAKKKKKKSKAGGGGGGGGGLSEAKEISDALASFLGKGKFMSRTEIVKCLWEYIREHKLQDPNNKREIILDDAMKAVFRCDSFNMFTMNKYVSSHVHPYKPVDLSTASDSTKKRKMQKSNAAAAAVARKTKKAKAAAAKSKKPGTQPPYRLSAELAYVTRADILPRPQVVSKIWEYIKANDLQNPEDKREILCDDALSRVMGGEARVTMFNMNQFISKHLLEKLDKTAYQHPEEAHHEEQEQYDEQPPQQHYGQNYEQAQQYQYHDAQDTHQQEYDEE